MSCTAHQADNVTPSGTPCLLVMDFGVAKAVSEAQPGRQQLTTARRGVGTPPRCTRAGEPLYRTSHHLVDIYAAGAMGYDVWAGWPPFRGLDTAQVSRRSDPDPESVGWYRPSNRTGASSRSSCAAWPSGRLTVGRARRVPASPQPLADAKRGEPRLQKPVRSWPSRARRKHESGDSLLQWRIWAGAALAVVLASHRSAEVNSRAPDAGDLDLVLSDGDNPGREVHRLCRGRRAR